MNRRWWVLVTLVAITITAATLASRVEFDDSIETWFLDDDPSLIVYNNFIEQFGADQIVIVGIFAEDVFDANVLGAIEQIATGSAELQFVERVQSITNSTIVRRLGGIRAADFREQVLASPLQQSALLADDAGAAAVVIYYSRDGKQFRQKRVFVEQLKRLVDGATADIPLSYAITGGPVIGEAAKARNSADMTTLVPIMIVVIVLIAYTVFRSVSLTLLPLGVVTMSVAWAYAVIGLVGWQMSMLSAVLIPLILAVGVAHSIHIVSAYRLSLYRGQDRDGAVKNSVVSVLKPCFFASFTTAAGLLSLLVSSLEPVRQFAVTAAVGVIAAFVVSFCFVPIMLRIIPVTENTSAAFAGRVVSRLLDRLHQFGQAHPRHILLVALAVAAAFTWLATRVESGLDPMIWIRHDDPIRADAERIDRAFGGALSLEFLVSSATGDLRDPAALRHLEKFEAWLTANTTVARVTSVADLVKEAARVARDAGIGGYALPKSKVVTNALLDRLERENELEPWISADYSTARISARIPLTSAAAIVAEIPAIERHIGASFRDSGLTVQMTGHAVLAGLMQTYMIDSQLYSFSVALVVVSLLMIVLLRSIPLGILAMVPNLLPIVIGLGAMTIFDIALNPATVMVAAVALGIVVDDTIHVMTAIERDVRTTGQLSGAIRSTILEVGRPVLITSVLLASGFALLLLGSFLPSRQIGGLIALIVIVALVTDLIVLPAILRLLPANLMLGFFRREQP